MQAFSAQPVTEPQALHGLVMPTSGLFRETGKSLMGLSLSFQVLVKLPLVQGSAGLLLKVWAIKILVFEGWGESLLRIFF